ncbi:MAG: hypothetical protein OXI29_00085 [bacterium]|nr:hypothetical protein [bacterium]
MTESEKDSEIMGMVRSYQRLSEKKVCLSERLRRHEIRLWDAAEIAKAPSTLLHVSEIDDLLESSKVDVIRQDVAVMVDTKQELERIRKALSDAGFGSLISKGSG